MTALSRRISYLYTFIILLTTTSSSQEHPSIHEEELEEHKSEKIIVEQVDVLTGLENLILNYSEIVANKQVGIVTNQTGLDSR